MPLLRGPVSNPSLFSARISHIRSYAREVPAPKKKKYPALISNKLLLARSQQPTPLVGDRKDVRKPGALRPHLGVKVRPEHGLWAFFRRAPDAAGNEKYLAIEDAHLLGDRSLGRSWTSQEIRRKSFRDLHTLWYIVTRERNLLATQNEAMRRMISKNVADFPVYRTRDSHCRKTHARIKQVLNERRLMYLHAESTLRAEEQEKKDKAREAEHAYTELQEHYSKHRPREDWERELDRLAESGELSKALRGSKAAAALERHAQGEQKKVGMLRSKSRRVRRMRAIEKKVAVSRARTIGLEKAAREEQARVVRLD